MTTARNREQAMEAFLLAIRAGSDVNNACRAADRSRKWYEGVRHDDPEFAATVDEARTRRKDAQVIGKDPDLLNLTFPEWRKKFLDLDTYPHQMLWIDVLEGNPPKIMHASVRYEPAGEGDRVLINTPPFHAKSATISQQWTMRFWRYTEPSHCGPMKD